MGRSPKARLAAVGAAEGQHLQDLLGGRPGWRRLSAIRRASRLIDTARPLSASNTSTPDRRGVDKGLEVGPSAVLVAVGARVGDR